MKTLILSTIALLALLWLGLQYGVRPHYWIWIAVLFALFCRGVYLTIKEIEK